MNSRHSLIKKACAPIDRRTLLRCSFAGGAGLVVNSLLGNDSVSAAFPADAGPIVETTAGKVR
jgi:hypothetical protein